MKRHLLYLLVVFLFVFGGNCQTYSLSNLTKTSNGFVGEVDLIAGGGPYGGNIKNLILEVYFETENRLRLKLVDRAKTRWQVHPWIIKSKTPSVSPPNVNYDIKFTNTPFGFIITRKEDGEIIFDASNLVFSDQYISLQNHMTSTSPNLYGFANRVSSFRLDTFDVTYTLYTFAKYSYENGNTYGTHPFYMEYKNSKASGVFLFNSNAMDVYVNGDLMEYRTIGGVLDFYFFMGSSPDEVVRQYHELIGKPHFPPRWSLGWNQMKYGYKNVTECWDDVKGYEKYGIPLDAIWTDIDYMDAYKDFTFDPVKFPLDKMQEMVDYVHSKNKKSVLIVDPGILIQKGYEAYDELLSSGAYIRTNDGKTPIVSKVWPGYCIFPDFENPKAHEYWFDMLSEFHSKLPFDGVLIDMNELCTFCRGSCGPNDTNVMRDMFDASMTHESFNPSKRTSSNFDPNNPPYLPGQTFLDYSSLSMDSVHYNGVINYDCHNLYGLEESNATSFAMERIRNKRSFVLSRSSWPGSGHVTSTWTGDNHSNFIDYQLSIPNILKIQMSGITHVGAIVCGFQQDTNLELCQRWTQLAIFYPFAMNHNNLGNKPQEPWDLGMEKFAAEQISMRYSLIPFFYTNFFRIHTEGGMFWKAIWMVFPEEMQASGIDYQFIVGDVLLVAPLLEIISSQKERTMKENEFPLDIYFPKTTWYDFYSFERVDGEGGYQSRLVSMEKIPVFIMGGKVLPIQDPAMNTVDQETNDYRIIVAFDDSKMASGELYLDDGESLTSVSKLNYTLVQFAGYDSKSDGKIVSTIVNDVYKRGCMEVKIREICVLGTEIEKVKSVVVNGKSVQFSFKDGNLVISNLNDVYICQKLSVVYGM